jgi:acyl-CoA thioesterase-1
MKITYVSRVALAIVRRLLQARRSVAIGVLIVLISGHQMAARAQPLTLVAFGDSLTAGYLLPQDQGFPAVLERELKARGHAVVVINGGVSGDTTADGLARLDWTIPEGVSGIILELGANDMLRGLDPTIPRNNLRKILIRLKARQIPVLLMGMKAQRNFGPDYVAAFDSIYPDLAREFNLPLYGFFLDGAAGHPDLSLQDGLHPNAAGVQKIIGLTLPSIEDFLAKLP